MDVVTPEEAKIAEEAGACAVMALERVPADIRRDGGVARMSDPAMIKGIQEAVTIPVMAKARIGHFAEAQVLQALEVDYIDESEVLTPADERNHIDKLAFEVPFVCGATNLGEALRRLGEGAAMIRSKGEAGTGNVVEAVRHMREITSGIKRLAQLRPEELAGGGERAPGAAGSRPGGRRRGPPAGAALLRRRHRDPGRRGADDAARRRGQLRRLGHLQELRPRAAGAGDRRGDDPLQRPRARRRRLDRASARRCPGSRSPASRPRTPCCRTAGRDGGPMTRPTWMTRRPRRTWPWNPPSGGRPEGRRPRAAGRFRSPRRDPAPARRRAAGGAHAGRDGGARRRWSSRAARARRSAS